jgi:uncharacterized protein involved in exopolysaccharide biosynthesis
MTHHEPTPSKAGGALPVTRRDLLAIAFRHQVVIVSSFVAIFLGVILVFVWTTAYEAHLTLLIKRERVDPVVNPDLAPLQQVSQSVSEQELNSEVELLRSQDLLEKVVVATGLHEQLDDSRWRRLWEHLRQSGPSMTSRRIATAVRALNDRLTVEPVRKTTMIRVFYTSKDPALAARVLQTLADFYLEKHLAVHRPPGAFDFFEQETDRYQKKLASARSEAARFAAKEGVFSVALEKEVTVRQLGEFEAVRQRALAQLAEAKQRVRTLEAQLSTTPARTTTEVRDAQARLMETQQSTLLTLELKRIELMQAFQPTYPPLIEVEKQIAETHASIEAAKRQPIVEAVTARDPTYTYLATELARARTEATAVEASLAATVQTLDGYRRKARRLDEVETLQHGIEHDVRLAEQHYTSYATKREEARISNALDVRRIVNVAVADAPIQPVLPSRPPRLVILSLAALLASLGSLGLAFTIDYFDPSFRTPDEIEAWLGTPVLAALPTSRRLGRGMP